MKTLKELIIEQKCRRGNFEEIDCRGIYWLCGKPVLINHFFEEEIYLRFLHYLDGAVRAELLIKHQSSSGNSKEESYRVVVPILSCETIEKVFVELHKMELPYIKEKVCLNEYHPILIKILKNLGLPMGFEPPDEN